MMPCMRRRDFLASGSLALVPATSSDQRARRAQLYELHRRALGPLFDSAGVWTGAHRAVERRDQLWHSMSFLSHPSTRALGNHVLRQYLATRRERDHFTHLGVVQVLARDQGTLDADVKSALMDLLREALKESKGTIRFGGANDNFAQRIRGRNRHPP